MKLNIGCGRNILAGWTNLDSMALPGVDIVHDLETCADSKLPLEDNSVEEFLLSHVIEHIRNTLPLMQELHRIAKPDAKLVIRLPHGASDDAWEDPTHVRAYFPQSFGYFSQPFYWRADYGYRGDWQLDKLRLFVKNSEYAGVAIEVISKALMTQRNVVMEMVAEMRAIKPIRPPQRDLQTPPHVEFVLS